MIIKLNYKPSHSFKILENRQNVINSYKLTQYDL